MSRKMTKKRIWSLNEPTNWMHTFDVYLNHVTKISLIDVCLKINIFNIIFQLQVTLPNIFDFIFQLQVTLPQ